MIIKNAYYPKQMPTKIVVETVDGRFCETDLSPFREIREEDLQPLALFVPEMGDEIPEYTMRFYHFARQSDNILKRLRLSVGMSQQKLAEISGVNVRQIQKIEAGEIKIGNVTLTNAIKLSAALGVALEELIK